MAIMCGTDWKEKILKGNHVQMSLGVARQLCALAGLGIGSASFGLLTRLAFPLAFSMALLPLVATSRALAQQVRGRIRISLHNFYIAIGRPIQFFSCKSKALERVLTLSLAASTGMLLLPLLRLLLFPFPFADIAGGSKSGGNEVIWNSGHVRPNSCRSQVLVVPKNLYGTVDTHKE